MDHFNATVHNGALVSTRRGLHVSKTRHHGTRFVNTFAAPTSASNAPSRSDSRGSADSVEAAARPQGHKFKFVAKPGEKTRGSTRGRPRASPASKASTPRSGSESCEDGAPGTASSRASSSAAMAPGPSANALGDSPRSMGAATEHSYSMSPVTSYYTKEWKDANTGQETPEMVSGPVNLQLNTAPRQHFTYEDLSSLHSHHHLRDSPYAARAPSDMVDMQPVFMGSILGQGAKGDERHPESSLSVNVEKPYSSVDDGMYDEGSQDEPAMLESLASMALVELFVGRYDNWHSHMKNLRYLINRSGGLKLSWGHILSKIRKADVKGAAYTGTTPYLDFTRFFRPISDILSPETKNSLSVRVQRLLQLCRVSQENMESVRALVYFAQATKIESHAPVGSYLFDPNAYIEEYTWVEQRLVRCPRPLRDEIFGSEDPYAPKQRLQNLDIGMLQPFAGSSFHSQLSPGHSIPTAPPPNVLDSVIRIASILYIEELLPEPYTVEPYSFLFSMLNQQIRTINSRLRERKSFLSDSGYGLDGLPQLQFLRPVMIWVCMVAYAVAKVAELDASIQTVILDLTPYQDCIGLLVGSKSSDLDLLSDQDFELCGLMQIQELRTVNCDDRMFLNQIVSDYSRRLMGPIDPYLQTRDYGMGN
ncbi:hypothetical protein B0I35DRAFT_480071 [Stachybotrys elegans]|uniref:Uncharacterized protein n=1 Tax=Stachybotrys elegans TaxID=80388 RepID=A0A8K0WQ59_9HYPO|nr:hypothetical protein B0I35DRAFT_480071 [Stachybotrys elegans]